MKILHIASFSGNIGDNASHAGLYRILADSISKPEITECEIRRFYNNYRYSDKQRFDSEFVDYANTFDQVIIGGGGFLEYHLPDSPNGTTLGFPPDVLKRITTPYLLCSLGCEEKQRIPEGNAKRFQRFLNDILEHPKLTLAIRNDGSRHVIDSVAPDASGEFPELLDNGFFFPPPEQPSPFGRERPYFALNLAYDQLFLRQSLEPSFSPDDFMATLADTLANVIQTHDLDIVLVPHIHSDLVGINALLGILDNWLVRTRVHVAPVVTGFEHQNAVWSLYRDATFVIATRLHANICSLVMRKPIVGIAVLNRIRDLYDSIGLSSLSVDPTGDLSSEIIQRSEALMKPGAGEDLNSSSGFAERARETREFYRNYFDA